MEKKSEPIRLITELAGAKQDAIELLEESIAEDYETVLIMGIKDGQMYLRNSLALSAVQVVGMMELLKIDFWDKHNNS